MNKNFKQIITNSFNTSEITDLIYNDLLVNNPEAKNIKIIVHFYSKNQLLIEDYFFFKNRAALSRYTFHNYLYTNYKNFTNKYITSEVDSYVIDIDFTINDS